MDALPTHDLSEPMQRRDFLHPRHLAHAAGQVLGAAEALTPEAEPAPEEIALLRLGWRAMATRFEIVLPYETPDACAAGQDCFEFLDELEDRLTVYRDHSAVCQLNRDAFRREVRVEAGLFALLRLCRDIWDASGGAFDVTAQSLIKTWGFFRGPKRVPGEEEIASALRCVGMQHVTLDESKKSIRFALGGIEITLGSIGKGYALDEMGQRLRSPWNLSSALLHGGSSSVLGIGCPPDDRRGWRVNILHPWKQEQTLATVWLRDRALGTSAATFQHLVHQGKKLGHILDPRTGWPAKGLASVSVLAPTAALADGLSTAVYVGGLDVAKRYCETHPDVGVIALPEGSREVVVIGNVATDL